MEISITINNVLYTSLHAMQGRVDDDVVLFLREWYSDKDYVMGHTSGSTGVPKPLRLLKSDMRASARLTNDCLGIASHSVLLLCLSTAYIAGKMMVVRALEAGASLVVVPPSSTPLRGLSERITLAAMVPMQVSETLRDEEGVRQLSCIDCLLVGGAPVDGELEQHLAALPTITYVTYGMTETVSHVALRKVGERCYTALGNVTFAIDDRSCLVIDAPQLSGRRFITNDIVELCSERQFVWQGRYDHVIMSGGLKFCAEVLEQKISSLLSSRYYITAAPDAKLGQRIVLVIEGSPYDELVMAAFRQRLVECLSPYEIPREIRFKSRFDETFSGKIKRTL